MSYVIINIMVFVNLNKKKKITVIAVYYCNYFSSNEDKVYN